MGVLFLMSKRYNKETAEDFGLVRIDDETASGPSDGSVWKRSRLYDWGWGEENGFFRLPFPEFGRLSELILHSEAEEDIYGSAAFLLRYYPVQTLELCESYADKRDSKEYQRLYTVLRLEREINYIPIIGKSIDEIETDYKRWENLAHTPPVGDWRKNKNHN